MHNKSLWEKNNIDLHYTRLWNALHTCFSSSFFLYFIFKFLKSHSLDRLSKLFRNKSWNGKGRKAVQTFLWRFQKKSRFYWQFNPILHDSKLKLWVYKMACVKKIVNFCKTWHFRGEFILLDLTKQTVQQHSEDEDSNSSNNKKQNKKSRTYVYT